MSMPVLLCHRCGRPQVDCRCMQEDAASLRPDGATTWGTCKHHPGAEPGCGDCLRDLLALRSAEAPRVACPPNDLCWRAEELVAEIFGIQEGAADGKTCGAAMVEVRRLVREDQKRSEAASAPKASAATEAVTKGKTLGEIAHYIFASLGLKVWPDGSHHAWLVGVLAEIDENAGKRELAIAAIKDERGRERAQK